MENLLSDVCHFNQVNGIYLSCSIMSQHKVYVGNIGDTLHTQDTLNHCSNVIQVRSNMAER